MITCRDRRRRIGFTLGLALIGAPGALVAQGPAGHDTSWVARSALYEVFVQDFSPAGTLRGMQAGLDRVTASGADVIWVMPVQPVGIERHKGTLGSHYAIRDYMAVEPTYGTLADFQAMVRAAHARGLKVILDWVPDHTAWDHPWVTQHADYYVHDAQGTLSVPLQPDGKPTDWTDVVQLDYRNPAVRREMLAAMKHWLVTYELDGFRVDVADFLPFDFWRETIPQLRAAVPRHILMLAESGDPEINRAGFDLTYGWDWYSRIKAVWRGASATTLVGPEVKDLTSLPAGGMRLRFTTNHDETGWDQPPVTLFGGPAAARAAFVATALLPGRPLLYNGQEVESSQKLGLFEKELVQWNGGRAAEARRFYRQVMELARHQAALRAGEFSLVETSAPDDVVAYRRGDLVVLVNARGTPVEFSVTGRSVAGGRDLLSGRVVSGSRVSLPAWGVLVVGRRRG